MKIKDRDIEFTKSVKFFFLLVGVLLVLSWIFPAEAGNKKERDYQTENCPGLVEWRLEDNTRVDCLTHTHAIEYDFSKKWAEAIGQSLHYASMTGKKAGIALIMRGNQAENQLDKMRGVILRYGLPIDVWLIDD